MDSFAALARLESRMTHIAGFERDQLLLLPEAVDDYVGADNPCGSSTPSSMGLTLQQRGSCGCGEGDGASGLCAGRPSEALHLRLSEPGPIEPAVGGGVSP